MNIEVVKKTKPIEETPFVIGGVYEAINHDINDNHGRRFVMLIKNGCGDSYGFVDPERGDGVWEGWLNEAEMIALLHGDDEDYPLMYRPNAKLVVEVD